MISDRVRRKWHVFSTWLRALLLGGLLCVSLGAQAESEAAVLVPATVPGVSFAETISQVTGIAISPLLGVGAVGAWRYFKTPSTQRNQLHWFSSPWFWVPALLLVVACFMKDLLGPTMPVALKKPFDLAEVFENKLSGLLATGAIVPILIDLFRILESVESSSNGAFLPGATLSSLGLASLDVGTLALIVIIPLGLLAYGAVFLVSHTLQILILLSPFASVDMLMKLARFTLLGTVLASALISPVLGTLWALALIGLCLYLSGWAFRLTVYGHVFAWDWLTRRARFFKPSAKNNWVFLSHAIEGVPRRTYGRLSRDAIGEWQFNYRPWLVGHPRQVPLPKGRWICGLGVLHPTVLLESGTECRDLLDLPPRFQGHETGFCELHGIEEKREVGLRAAWSWLRGILAPA